MTEPQSHPAEPRRFEDLPWRIRHRLRRGAYHAFGPPQLDGADDPLRALDRERAQRLAERAARRAQRSAGDP